ncbi:MAG: FtsK/SpoIIIE domain-containing protein [Agromyces sp.]
MPRTPFPIWATLVPMIGAVVLWMLTGSPIVLAFAALGPLAAFASRFDARRADRLRERAAAAMASSEQSRINEVRESERAAELRSAWQRIVPIGDILDGTAPHTRNRSLDVLVGTADQRPVTLPCGHHVGIVGEELLTSALARTITVQQAHGGGAGTVVQARSRPELGPCDAVIEVRSLRRATVHYGPGESTECEPHFLATRTAERWFASHSYIARSGAGPLAVAFGRTELGMRHSVDLGNAPHALVAGTTGSGKTELLRAWVLAMCEQNSPSELIVVCFDFKGGTGFAELDELPHVADVLTDLDDSRLDRVLGALRSELTRREHLLRALNARSIDAVSGGELARLVILVDEYQLLLERASDATSVFADIAARGRALGVHLILATQHPSRVVRDHIAANCGLRIAMRLIDSAESQSFLGSSLATTLTAAGSALSRDETGVTQWGVQAVSDADIHGVSQVWAESDIAPSPWLPALDTPERVTEIARSLGPGTFGILDDVSHRTFTPLRVQDVGALRVCGPARTGRTGVLRRICEQASATGQTVRCLSDSDLAGAWQELRELQRSDTSGVLLVDNVDDLLAGLDPEYRHELIESLRQLSKQPSLQLVYSTRGPTPIDELVPHQITLTSRGRGLWSDLPIHIVPSDCELPAPPPARRWSPMRCVIGVSNSLTRTLEFAQRAGLHPQRAPRTAHELIETIGAGAPSNAPVLLHGPVEHWMMLSSAMADIDEEIEWVFLDGNPSALRSVLNYRDVPPLLNSGEFWRVLPGSAPDRARLSGGEQSGSADRPLDSQR